MRDIQSSRFRTVRLPRLLWGALVLLACFTSACAAPATSQEIVVYPDSVEFGEVMVTNSRSMVITLTNSTSEELHIGPVSLEIDGEAPMCPFVVEGETNEPEGVLVRAGESTHFEILFEPSAEGTFGGVVLIETDIRDDAFRVAVSGAGSIEDEDVHASIPVPPGHPEICNDGDTDFCQQVVGIYDRDGDGTEDSSDDDKDGFNERQGDCNDKDDRIHPGAFEVCDGLDQDCDGLVDEGLDQDGDGYTVTPCEEDCDDEDPASHPDIDDIPNGADDDCDGIIDDGMTFASCDEIHQYSDEWPSGTYLIDPSGGTGTPFEVTCDMETEGGGWTLVLDEDWKSPMFWKDRNTSYVESYGHIWERGGGERTNGIELSTRVPHSEIRVEADLVTYRYNDWCGARDEDGFSLSVGTMRWKFGYNTETCDPEDEYDVAYLPDATNKDYRLYAASRVASHWSNEIEFSFDCTTYEDTDEEGCSLGWTSLFVR